MEKKKKKESRFDLLLFEIAVSLDQLAEKSLQRGEMTQKAAVLFGVIGLFPFLCTAQCARSPPPPPHPEPPPNPSPSPLPGGISGPVWE